MIILPLKKDLINAFMSEAKTKNGINKGMNNNYNLAIGLVDVSISFEAFINELLPSEKSIFKKREKFSTDYQLVFEQNKAVFMNWANSLKRELDNNGMLIDMTPQSTRPHIGINNPDSLSEIIEVVYRVRSNLVHGSKDLTEGRSKILIENSFKFLYNLLDIILRKEGIIS